MDARTPPRATKTPGKRKNAPAATPGHRVAPVDRIERWPIGRLVPYVRNPRQHAPEQVEQIAASLREFGQTQLVVVDEAGEIIAGHGRVAACCSGFGGGTGSFVVVILVSIGRSEVAGMALREAAGEGRSAEGSRYRACGRNVVAGLKVPVVPGKSLHLVD